jgi:Mg/Co/Ni transporter MgtE
MIEATLADLRQSASFFKTTQVVHIVNGRKKEDIGYFVPNIFKDKFESFLMELEKDKKRKLLHRIAKVSALDTIGDGTIDDGIE